MNGFGGFHVYPRMVFGGFLVFPKLVFGGFSYLSKNVFFNGFADIFKDTSY